MGQLTPPATVAQFETLFTRDFAYGPGLDKVRPVDIQNALNAASSVFNPCLFSTAPIGVAPAITSEALNAYLYAAAHFLVTGLQAVGGLGKVGGGTNSQGEGVVGNKSVGGVSVGYVWPDTVTGSPVLFQFTKTTYGQTYLQMLMPKLVGNVSAVLGEVTGTPGEDFPITGFLSPF